MIIKIELNDAQFNNLFTFLNRTSLSGNEVPAFIEIMQILQKAKGGVSDELDK